MICLVYSEVFDEESGQTTTISIRAETVLLIGCAWITRPMINSPLKLFYRCPVRRCCLLRAGFPSETKVLVGQPTFRRAHGVEAGFGLWLVNFSVNIEFYVRRVRSLQAVIGGGRRTHWWPLCSFLRENCCVGI